MNAYIIAESTDDVELLRRLLPPDLSCNVEFLAGGDLDGVKSMARSVVVSSRKPVVVVIDAHTANSSLVHSRRQAMKEVIGAASNSVALKVVMAVPELEYIFFEAPGLLTRLYPDATSNAYLMELARFSSRKALEAMDNNVKHEAIRRKLLANIQDSDLRDLRNTTIISEITDFLLGCRCRRVKIRVEIGPGLPSDLQSLKEPQGWKALVRAFLKVLTAETWPAEGVVTASSGDVTVTIDPKKFNARTEPGTSIPTTFVIEVEGEASTEKREPSDS
jgi:hypothetical protein